MKFLAVVTPPSIDQSSTISWLVTTLKTLISKTTRDIQPPVLSFRLTQDLLEHSSYIIAAFKGKSGEALESQQVTSMEYVSEFSGPNRISNLFRYREDRDKLLGIVESGPQYNLSLIEEDTRISDLSYISLRGKHKSAKTTLNSKALWKEV